MNLMDEDFGVVRRSRLLVVLLPQTAWKRRWFLHRMALSTTLVASWVSWRDWERTWSDRGSYRVRRWPFGVDRDLVGVCGQLNQEQTWQFRGKIQATTTSNDGDGVPSRLGAGH